jgi:Tol biopolymer transport system component
MTQHDRFIGSLDAWLHEEGAQTMPPYVDAVIARTAATRQRPAWMSPGRWFPMDSTLALRTRRVPPLVRYLVLAVLVLLVAVAVLVLSGAGRPRPPAPFGPAANGLIAYDADGTLTTVGVDGTTRSVLDVGLANASRPTFSPDGTRVAFLVADEETGLGGLYVASADGGGARLVTPGIVFVAESSSVPVWSPDGTRLVLGMGDGGYDRVAVAASDGSGAAFIGENPADGLAFPSWSPDGAWIAVASYPPAGAPRTVQLIRPDGSGQHPIVTATDDETVIQDLRWAPDGSGRLAYVIGGETDSRIEIVNVDDGSITVVDARPGIFDMGISWSPDGQRIASNQSEIGSIVVDADGTNMRTLELARCAGQVDWSPDGTRLLCLSSVALGDGRYELLVIDPDGSEAPTIIPLGGEASGQSAAVVSWQRLAP